MIVRNIKFLSIIVVTCALVGCVRYIDSRKDLVEQFGDFDPAEQRVGVTGFYRYEQEQRKRLETLINDRDLDAIKNPTSLYQIGAGDEVTLTVKNFVEVSKNYTVRPDGSIRLPFVGKVTLAGLTETEAIEFIESLVTDYVVDPQVDLQVTSYSANVVWLMNSNNTTNGNTTDQKIKSAYPIKSNQYSLVDLLLEVGDSNLFSGGVIHFYPAPSGSQDVKANKDLMERFNSFSVSNWVGKTFENEDCDGREFTPEGTKFRVKACYPYENKVSQEELLAKYDPNARIEIDTEEVFGGATRAPLRLILKPGDIIYIPPPATVQIFGEVNGRGTYQVSSNSQGGGMGSGGGGGIKPTLLSALSAARGLTYSADINNMYIYREIHFANKSILNVDLEKIVLWAGQDVRLRDGDIIYVPSKSGRYSQEQSVNLINQLTGSITNVDRAVDINQ